MTELEAVRLLRSPVSTASARHDAEAELRALGWSPLAIKLAKGENPGPVSSSTQPPPTMTYEEARDIANGT